jgi:hypothetical protein
MAWDETVRRGRRGWGWSGATGPVEGSVKENERWASAFLLRGEAVPGVNEYQPRPRYVEGQHMPFQGCQACQG